MKSKSLVFLAIPVLALASLTGCKKKADETIIIYNWADYIYDGTDDDGNIVEEGVVELFENYYKDKYGKTLEVDYRTFSTPEEMYNQIKTGSISPDLICPSDYMIQKMANEGMLEKFSYDEASSTYGDSLKNFGDYGSPFIKDRFKSVKLKDGNSFLSYALPYFWGTMGFTYDDSYFTAEDVESWECLWNSEAKFQGQFSLKNSMRDTYVTAIFHVYHDEIVALDESDPNYNANLSDIFNRCDDATIAKVEAALIQALNTTVSALEVDEGKDEITKPTCAYHANLAWSGDAIYAMDSTDEDETKTLCYSLPTEGSNVWFDGWCMPKGANKAIAEEFVNFISSPEIAAMNMEYVGYTSPIVGEEVWNLVNTKYAAPSGVESYEVDLSFYFGTTAKINVPTSEEGRQFDAQYPTEEVLKKCCMMNDFGSQQKKVEDMWVRVQAA